MPPDPLLRSRRRLRRWSFSHHPITIPSRSVAARGRGARSLLRQARLRMFSSAHLPLDPNAIASDIYSHSRRRGGCGSSCPAAYDDCRSSLSSQSRLQIQHFQTPSSFLFISVFPSSMMKSSSSFTLQQSYVPSAVLAFDGLFPLLQIWSSLLVAMVPSCGNSSSPASAASCRCPFNICTIPEATICCHPFSDVFLSLVVDRRNESSLASALISVDSDKNASLLPKDITCSKISFLRSGASHWLFKYWPTTLFSSPITRRWSATLAVCTSVMCFLVCIIFFDAHKASDFVVYMGRYAHEVQIGR